MMLAVGWRKVRPRSGDPGWHPRLAAEQLDECIECADVVLGRGGEVGADGSEPLGSRQALEAVAHLGVDFGHADSGLSRIVRVRVIRLTGLDQVGEFSTDDPPSDAACSGDGPGLQAAWVAPS